jgi:hypothetical protein
MLHKCDEIKVNKVLNRSQGLKGSSRIVRLQTATLLVEAIASCGDGFVRPDNVK